MQLPAWQQARHQRIAIARMLLKNAPILVLDEATSLIDPGTARHLEGSMAALLADRTVVAIAHRLHTAHDADRIAVVIDGRIVEIGSHDELIALDKATGKVIWDRHMGNYSWSSPTLFTAADGTQYGVVTDSEGVIHLFDPNTGLDISTLNIGKNIEATPAIFNDMLVVASYDRHIYGIRIS